MTDGKLLSGQRLAPETTLVSVGGQARLHYQGDGNLVVYLDGTPFWSSRTDGVSAGHLKMRRDGNLVVSDAAGNGVAASGTHGHPGAMVQLQDDGNFVIYEDQNGPLAGTPIWASSTGAFYVGSVAPEAGEPTNIKQFVGAVRRIGRSFGDDSGPRILHGCSWFPALCIMQQDRNEALRQLDRIAAHQHYVRILWRLNGWHWSGDGSHPSANLTVDPIRDTWFEMVLRDFLTEANARGLRVNLSTGDMNGWSEAQQDYWFRRVSEIAASVSPEVVWLNAVANEMRGTWSGGNEDDYQINRMSHLMKIMKAAYPNAQLAGSDPGSMDKEGMMRLAPSPATVALIHTRPGGGITDFLRRTYNNHYENYPGMPVVEDEPSGPNGTYNGPFSQKMYQPIERPIDLFALYTMQVLVGSASTYFNDPALLTRQPLDSTWGFKELPELWRQMEIPQDVGQGRLVPGHKANAPIRIGSGAERCDSVICPGDEVAFGIIHGGGNWNIPSGWDADATFYNAQGEFGKKRVRVGEQLVASGAGHTDPLVVRLTR